MDEKKKAGEPQPSREQFIRDVEAQIKKGRQSLDGLIEEMNRSKRLLDEQSKPRK